jgi:hypothetical protein
VDAVVEEVEEVVEEVEEGAGVSVDSDAGRSST